MVSLSRGAFLKAAAAASAAVALAACSTGSKDSSSASSASATAESGAFPVTIQHAYGSTTIDSEPKTVVGIGWINAEVALALGVVVAGSGQVGWGENSNHSTDWFDSRLKELGASQPKRFTETDGINFEEIAKLNPDLILAVVGTVSEADYKKLSDIADTVVHAKDDSTGYTTPWQTYTETIGKALGRPEAAKKIVEETEQKITDAAGKHSQIKDATFIASSLMISNSQPSISLYSNGDNREVFFKALGMKEASVVANADFKNTFYITWSNEKASELKSDMLYSWLSSSSDEAAIKKNSVLKQIPAIAKDAAVLDPDKGHTNALNSTLGLNWLIDETDFVQQVADAVTNGKK